MFVSLIFICTTPAGVGYFLLDPWGFLLPSLRSVMAQEAQQQLRYKSRSRSLTQGWQYFENLHLLLGVKPNSPVCLAKV